MFSCSSKRLVFDILKGLYTARRENERAKEAAGFSSKRRGNATIDLLQLPNERTMKACQFVFVCRAAK
jgi:hypothetical protein